MTAPGRRVLDVRRVRDARLSGVTIRRVRGLGAALVLAGAVSLSGCAAFSPVQTEVIGDVADGVPVDLGAVRIDNLLVVAPAKGGPGTISASVVNSSGQEVAIAFTDQASGSSARFAVPAFTTRQISSQSDKVELASVSAPPGAVITMDVTSPISGTSIVTVPVLSEQSYYQTLLPTPAASTPSATAG